MNPNQSPYQAIIQTPIGALGVCVQNLRLNSIDFLPGETKTLAPLDATTAQITQSLQAYLQDPQSGFPFEPLLNGTEFQLRVWRRLLQIPPGATVTYGQLAHELHSSPRAIGNACRANPCPLVVPCHRVVGKTGLGGFAGKSSGPKLQLKIWLLTHERGLQESQPAA